MGLIKAALGAAGGVMADQWKEYFYSEALTSDMLMVKGKKKISGRSANVFGSDNIISNGSVIAVADGQCMLLVDQGKVTEVCAQPGEFIYDAGSEPSVFTGDLGSAVKNTFVSIGRRFTFGGEAPKDQRVYYINTKEIIGNKYGTPNPVPYRVVDERAGIDLDISVRCYGEYSYRITDPVLFYTNVCGNAAESYRRDDLDGQLRTELLTALQPAFAKISAQGIRYSALPGHTEEMSAALYEILSKKWKELRGIEMVSFGVSSVKASEEDEQMIKQMQRNAALTNQSLAAATLVGAKAQAMQDAAKNENGAAMAFMGMQMAQNADGTSAAQLFAQAAEKEKEKSPQGQTQQWTCPNCGASNTGNFCTNCGTKKPEEKLSFCPNCGAPVPDPSNPPKFCPQCGNRLKD